MLFNKYKTGPRTFTFDDRDAVNAYLKTRYRYRDYVGTYDLILKTHNGFTFWTYKIEDLENGTIILYVNSKNNNLNDLFSYIKAIDSVDITEFDFSNIRYMNDTFKFLELDESIDFSEADLSNIVSMDNCFKGMIIDDGEGDLVFKNHTLTSLKSATETFNFVSADKIDIDIDAPKLKYDTNMLKEARCNEIKTKGIRPELLNEIEIKII